MNTSPIHEAYAAALLDGEGNISVAKQKREDSCLHGWSHQLCVRFAMTQPQAIDFMVAQFGFRMERTHRRLPSGRTLYRCYVNGPEAKAFLEKVRPYVLVKQREIDLAIQFPLRPMSNRRISEEDYNARNNIYRQLRALRAV